MCASTGPTCVHDTSFCLIHALFLRTFQYCGSCTVFVNCTTSSLSLDPCPGDTRWDDTAKNCVTHSTTCTECYTPCNESTAGWTLPPRTTPPDLVPTTADLQTSAAPEVTTSYPVESSGVPTSLAQTEALSSSTTAFPLTNPEQEDSTPGGSEAWTALASEHAATSTQGPIEITVRWDNTEVTDRGLLDTTTAADVASLSSEEELDTTSAVHSTEVMSSGVGGAVAPLLLPLLLFPLVFIALLRYIPALVTV